ncbi:hypothetical protein EP47_09235 [Legionella norrlandica]|uniref:Flagellar motor switch protein FliN-like C-terminal domain-containing protein n=1 Tax=Legionella norrlandica TaxID=1498499 RepID=A0A0A2SQ89_9GAMM|nr:FliM/FliN family flagellar motor C-terminal domain-containing protein [Legionella norrlandica]KGP63305.1 hypothetical protein EP47_09235 [Legionella norrlandica]
MKPYRLINRSELEVIKQHCLGIITRWSNEFCLVSPGLELSKPQTLSPLFQGFLIKNNDRPLAIVENHYLSFVNELLFGTDKSCFDSVSQTIFADLLKQLFTTEPCFILEPEEELPNWFYPGSSSLLLTFSIGYRQLQLILSSDWVNQQLPSIKSTTSETISFDKTIEEQIVTLTVELDSIKLPLEQLINLQSGDVVTTDHLISQPLRITRKKQLIAQGKLGQSSLHKSILLKNY